MTFLVFTAFNDCASINVTYLGSHTNLILTRILLVQCWKDNRLSCLFLKTVNISSESSQIPFHHKLVFKGFYVTNEIVTLLCFRICQDINSFYVSFILISLVVDFILKLLFFYICDIKVLGTNWVILFYLIRIKWKALAK